MTQRQNKLRKEGVGTKACLMAIYYGSDKEDENRLVSGKIVFA